MESPPVMTRIRPDQWEENLRAVEEHYAKRLKSLKIVKTTRTPRGHILDWVPLESQVPDGRIPEIPPPLPKHRASSHDRPELPAVGELVGHVGEMGPPGTVPIRRPDVAKMDHSISLADRLRRKVPPPHLRRGRIEPPDPNRDGHFYGNANQGMTCYGCEGIFSCFAPAVSSPHSFSLIQTGLANSQQTDQQTLEAGWQLAPDIYGSDYAPHLFTYYTTNGYKEDKNNEGGYNRDQEGWVQVDRQFYPGMTFVGWSEWDGPQHFISIRYQLIAGKWWLNVLGDWVGYYPATLFAKTPPGGSTPSTINTLGDHGDSVGFWGEVADDNKPPSTQMGSGYFAGKGWGWSAYMHNLLVQTDANGTMTPFNAPTAQSDPTLYTIEDHFTDTGSLKSHMFVGGPGVFSAPPSAPTASHVQVGLTQTDVFTIDKNGTLYVAWVVGGGGWGGPVPIGRAGTFMPGAPLAASQQFGLQQTDVFAINRRGALTVSWVDGGGSWNGPIEIGPAERFASSGWLAVSEQFGLTQTDVFAVDRNGALTVTWGGAGPWQGPAAISPNNLFMPGASVAASRQFGLTQTDVFAVNKDGALTVTWAGERGPWQGPVAISPARTFLPTTSVAASRQFGLDQTDVFAVDHNGTLTVSWVSGGGTWQGPAAISPAGTFAPGSALCASRQFSLDQTDVFVVDKSGALTVTWVGGGGAWKGPVAISPAGLALAGAAVSACQQTGLDQTDVFVVDKNGDVNVFWVGGGGTWSGPIHP